jgi:hypothetical protein
MIRIDTSVWATPGLLKRLKAHAASRMFSAGHIAKLLSDEFGVGITRNMVCGKMWRLQIGARPRPKSTKRLHPLIKVDRPAKPDRAAPVAPGEPTPAGDVPTGCRWLSGDPIHRNFCGSATLIGKSWCAYHQRVVWTPRVKPVETRKRWTSLGVPIY